MKKRYETIWKKTQNDMKNDMKRYEKKPQNDMKKRYETTWKKTQNDMEKRYETIWLERAPERGLQHVHTENVQRVIRNTQRATSNKA